jgi:1,4-alpha-glucan branching enzyme
MWAHPGKQLLFMGAEVAQEREWSHDRSIDWHLVDQADHRGVQDLVGELNRLQAELGALWRCDFRSEGFRWLDAADRSTSVFAFARSAGSGRPADVICVANLTPVPRYGYRVGLPDGAGEGSATAPVVTGWREVLNTDDQRWGGSGVVNPAVVPDEVPWQGCQRSALLTLPPLAVLWLAGQPASTPSGDQRTTGQ